MSEIDVTHRPLEKRPLPLAAVATHMERHRHRSEDENSTYRLMIRYKRG